MKAKFSLLILVLGFFACQNGTTSQAGSADLEGEIDKLGKEMYDETTNKLNTDVANQFIATCEAFAKANPGNDKSPEYLLKAGETARTLKQFPKGLAIYDQVIQAYPDHPKAAQALFLKGFTLDNDMNQPEQARAIYTAFLEKYPKNDFADDTQFLLNNLGKTDDEIIKSFEQNKQAPESE